MKQETQQKLERLTHLAHAAQNKKIVLEEIRLLAAEAFDLQDELMAELDVTEAVETDIKTVQELFETREFVWDTINQIALREREIKESHASRTAFQAHQKKAMQAGESDCCCCHSEKSHQHTCSHEHTGACGCHHQETTTEETENHEHACCHHGHKKCCCH